MRAFMAVLLSICLLFSSVTPSVAQVIPVGPSAFRGAAVKLVKNPEQLVRGMQRLGGANVRGYTANLVSTAVRSGAVRSVNMHTNLRNVGLVRNATAQFSAVSTPAFAEKVLLGENSLSQLTGIEMESYVFSGFTSQLLEGTVVPSTIQVRAEVDMLARYIKEATVVNGDHIKYFAKVWGAASYIGLLGTRENAAEILSLAEGNYGGLNPYVDYYATRILLNLEAYDELRALAKFRLAKPNGMLSSVWSGVKEEMAKRGEVLEVDEMDIADLDPVIPDLLQEAQVFREPYMAALGDPSADITKAYLEIGQGLAEKFDLAHTQFAAQQAVVAQLSVKPQPAAVRPGEIPAAEIPALEVPAFPQGELTLGAPEIPAGVTETPAVTPAAKPATSSNSGILYSGFPFFALQDSWNKVTSWWKARQEARALVRQSEAPGLHDATRIHPVSDPLLDYQRGVASADETEGLSEKPLVDFAEDGFLLTLEDANGHESILPVNLRISNRFLNRNWSAFVANHSKTPYNRVVVKPEARLKKGDYVLEMRNKTRKPSTMDHFYFRLQNNQVGLLVDMLQQQGVENFRLKLEASPNNFYRSKAMPVFREGTMEQLPLTVTVPSDNLNPDAKLVLMNNGELGWLLPGAKKPVRETKLYVRIPKHQISDLVKVLKEYPANSSEKLNIALRSTQNGAKFVSTWLSASNLSLGKTFGPMVGGPLEISPSNADRLMFGTNYVLPGLASLLTPALKKYGERRMMTLSMALSTLSGVLAVAGGFYGFVDGVALNGLQKGLFLSALLLMSASGVLKQLTTNLLIRANGGEVEYITDNAEDAAQAVQVVDETPKALVKRRGKEVFQQIFHPKKYAQEHGQLLEEDKTQLSHLIRYNLGFIFKNVGTLSFLALPYGINVVGHWFGADLGLDFSASFPIYAVYSGWLTWRMMRAKLRDAYSAKNVIQNQNAITRAVDDLAAELTNPKHDAEQIDVKTRALYDALDSYVLARQKVDSKLKHNEVYARAKQESLEALAGRLGELHMDPAKVPGVVSHTTAELSKLENLFKNMAGMLKVEGVAPLLAGMTLATVHEFVVSSSFAGAMNQVIPAGDMANFLVAVTLYLPMIIGRIGGNWLSPKISAGSMYMFCSALSALGTMAIGLSGGSVPMMIAGAAVANLGMGNFFTQMFNYIMEKHKKYRREISSLVSLTMAFGGLGAMLAPGTYTWDMVFAGGLLGLSWLMTVPMFASSSLIKMWKETPLGKKVHEKGRQSQVKLKAKMKKDTMPDLNVDDAAPAN